VLRVGVKLGLSHEGKNVDRVCLGTGCCGECLDPGRREWPEAGADCIMNFRTCMLHQIS
jgi:hypothetical protein